MTPGNSYPIMKPMHNTAATLEHPFERAGLGVAPFRVVGVEERRGPITTSVGGVLVQVGAPGQPMGTCDYCGTGIAECWQIESADRRRFIVGCDCVRKTKDTSLLRQIDPQLRALQREKRAKLAARKRAELAELLADEPNRALLAALPHPYADLAGRGLTLLDFASWMDRCAGAAGRARALKAVRAALEARQ